MSLLFKFGLLLLLIWLGLRWFERTSLYFPNRQYSGLPQSYGLAFEEASFSARDGTWLTGWFIPAPGPYTVMICHGNAGNISHRIDKAARLHKLGLNVLLFDYRGYGKSQGSPSEKGTYQDGDAAYAYLVDMRKIPSDHILLYGESLGCAIAVEMALRHPARALILESPFTSTVQMANAHFPRLPARWIVRYRYDNLSKIPKNHMPLMILHSSQDEIIPFSMGRQLFAAATGEKQFVELIGGHNDGYVTTGNRYLEAWKIFLRNLDRHRPQP